MVEELPVPQRIEGGIPFGKSVRLARKGIEPIAQSAVESFDMHRSRWLSLGSQRGTDLHRQQSSPLITMLDRLRQPERLGDDQTRTPPFARAHRLAVGPLQDAAITMPAIAKPGEGALMRPVDCGGHGLLDQVLTHGAGGAGDHETTVPILDQAAPAFSFVRLLRCSLFFCTNDQNSSISTWLRCRSLASTCVRASACVAARLSQALIVSYL